MHQKLSLSKEIIHAKTNSRTGRYLILPGLYPTISLSFVAVFSHALSKFVPIFSHSFFQSVRTVVVASATHHEIFYREHICDSYGAFSEHLPQVIDTEEG